ncbi:MAG: hypothetical protein U0T83_10830 [Bacteriovoracaceae bacterium]
MGNILTLIFGLCVAYTYSGTISFVLSIEDFKIESLVFILIIAVFLFLRINYAKVILWYLNAKKADRQTNYSFIQEVKHLAIIKEVRNPELYCFEQPFLNLFYLRSKKKDFLIVSEDLIKLLNIEELKVLAEFYFNLQSSFRTQRRMNLSFLVFIIVLPVFIFKRVFNVRKIFMFEKYVLSGVGIFIYKKFINKNDIYNIDKKMVNKKVTIALLRKLYMLSKSSVEDIDLISIPFSLFDYLEDKVIIPNANCFPTNFERYKRLEGNLIEHK